MPTVSTGTKNAYEVAAQHKGTTAAYLKRSDSEVGRMMDDGVANNVNCANFVSAVIESAGQIAHSQRSNSASGLVGNLSRDPNWDVSSSLANAKPGDVVMMNTGHGNHIVLYAGKQNGKHLFIGSNNVNKDGSQSVTISSMGYRVTAVCRFKGGPDVVGATGPSGGFGGAVSRLAGKVGGFFARHMPWLPGAAALLEMQRQEELLNSQREAQEEQGKRTEEEIRGETILNVQRKLQMMPPGIRDAILEQMEPVTPVVKHPGDAVPVAAPPANTSADHKLVPELTSKIAGVEAARRA